MDAVSGRSSRTCPAASWAARDPGPNRAVMGTPASASSAVVPVPSSSGTIERSCAAARVSAVSRSATVSEGRSPVSTAMLQSGYLSRAAAAPCQIARFSGSTGSTGSSASAIPRVARRCPLVALEGAFSRNSRTMTAPSAARRTAIALSAVTTKTRVTTDVASRAATVSSAKASARCARSGCSPSLLFAAGLPFTGTTATQLTRVRLG